MTALYYKVHVTLDPVSGPKLEELNSIAKNFRFRVAELLMRKGGPHEDDSFCTTRETDYEDIKHRTINFVLELQRRGFTVRRYKLEDTLVDSKIVDAWSLL